MAKGWAQARVPKFLILSGEDHTAKEFEEYILLDSLWQTLVINPDVGRFYLSGADHTFSKNEHRQLVEAATLHWIGEWVAKGKVPAASGDFQE